MLSTARGMLIAVILALSSGRVWGLQSPQIAVRLTTTETVTDSGTLANVTDVHELPDGRVLVNDRTRRQVLLFDATLSRATTVFGEASGSVAAYVSSTRLLRYGDSTVFVDLAANSLIVLAPSATIAHAIAPLHARDLVRIASTSYGTSAFDAQGREVYQGASTYPPGDVAPPKGDSAKPVITKRTRVGPIVRADFDTRTIDTLAWLHLPFEKFVDAGNAFTIMYNPLPMADDWALLSDGTIAIVRAQDYHVDWIGRDGKLTSTGKMPFDWRSLTLEEKDRIRDSVKAYYETLRAKQRLPPGARIPPLTVVDAADMPDFFPSIRQGSVISDLDGNLWILPSTSRFSTGGVVYDVVNREGRIFQRVALLPSRTVAGFGRNGVIYLRKVMAAGDERLERVTLKQP